MWHKLIEHWLVFLFETLIWLVCCSLAMTSEVQSQDRPLAGLLCVRILSQALGVKDFFFLRGQSAVKKIDA